MKLRLFQFFFLFIITTQRAFAQTYSPSDIQTSQKNVTWAQIVQPRVAETPVELFCGIDLHYADINFLRLYNTLINLTPGIKWNMGNDWRLTAQCWLPLSNEGYAERYSMIRLSNFTLSKEIHFPALRQHIKFTAGLFGRERWGTDIKWMMPLNNWLMLQAQGGLTRHWALAFGIHGESESDFNDIGNGITSDWIATGTLGARIYLREWNTEFVLSGGRYLNKDNGAQLEAARHFKHCTITLFGLLHERGNTIYTNQRIAGGFKILVQLDRKGWNIKSNNKKVMFRPASVFRLTYSAQADNESMRTYTTDPEENERVLPMRIY